MIEPRFTFWDVSMPDVPEPRARIYDHYLAELPEPPWGTSGCKLGPNTVIAATRRTDPYRYAFKYAGRWHEHALVSRDDPGIRQLEAAGRLVYGAVEDTMQRVKRAQRETAEHAERARSSGLQP